MIRYFIIVVLAIAIADSAAAAPAWVDTTTDNAKKAAFVTANATKKVVIALKDGVVFEANLVKSAAVAVKDAAVATVEYVDEASEPLFW